MTMKIALVLLVATNLIGHLQATAPYCVYGDFQLVSDESDGLYSACKQLDFQRADSAADCAAIACDFENGNTFNYAPSTKACSVKKCNNQELKISQGTKWKNREVWSLSEDESVACTGTFVRIPYDSAAAIGNCKKIHTAGEIDTLDDCIANTCRFGGNALAYNGTESECQSKLCVPSELTLDASTEEGTYEVWIIPEVCYPDGALRLIHGPSDDEGVPQMCKDNEWGYICDQPGLHVNGWPGVFCRQKNGEDSEALSAKLAKKIRPKVSIDESFPIHLEAPSCNINKHDDINDCPHNPRTDKCKGNKYKKTAYIECSSGAE